MRRALLTMMVVGVLIAAMGVANPRTAEAQPGYFNFSIGTPGYYAPYAAPYPQGVPYGYSGYGGYGGGYSGYAAPVAPQAYFGATVPFGGIGLGYGYSGVPYGGYYRGGWPGYGYGHHYGHGHHHF